MGILAYPVTITGLLFFIWNTLYMVMGYTQLKFDSLFSCSSICNLDWFFILMSLPLLTVLIMNLSYYLVNGGIFILLLELLPLSFTSLFFPVFRHYILKLFYLLRHLNVSYMDSLNLFINGRLTYRMLRSLFLWLAFPSFIYLMLEF